MGPAFQLGQLYDYDKNLMSKAQDEFRTLLDAVAPFRDAVDQHPLYVELKCLVHVHVFM